MSRKLRLAESLRRLVSEVLARDVRDARLDGAMVSVARVELNEDMSVATVWVSLLGSNVDPARALAALDSASPFIRRAVGKQMQIRQAPELRFLHDTSPEFAIRLRGILLDDERRASEAGRKPGEGPPADAGSGSVVAGEDVPEGTT